MMSEDQTRRAREAVDTMYRSESRHVLATLIRLLGDYDAAEEALHDAFAEGARSSSSPTSCSGPTTRQGARPARRSRMGSTASSSTSPTTTSYCGRCRGRRSRSCRLTSGGWGWGFPWASSHGGDFNLDFQASFTEEQQHGGALDYNYRRDDPVMHAGLSGGQVGGPAEFAAMTGTNVATYTREREGMSAFALEDGVDYHGYSTYARGVDGLWGMYQWPDRASKGRNETGPWFRRHDDQKI
jgi:hypothetical protein